MPSRRWVEHGLAAVSNEIRSTRSLVGVRSKQGRTLWQRIGAWLETTEMTPMSKRQPWGSRETLAGEDDSDLHELVLGLHWDPPCEDWAGQIADLDAVCAVVDLEGKIVEVVHPGHPRNADGSIVHTGDARTGASEWDDERIFIFLDALPEAASRLLFVVSSANGVPFDSIPGAQCHVSDRLSETPRVRVDLTAFAGLTLHVAAIVSRGVDRWRVDAGACIGEPAMLAELRGLLRRTK